MKKNTQLRMYSLALFFSVFVCYFEWADQSAFLFQIQYEILRKMEASSFVHPLIIAPALGQIVLLISLFKPNRKLTLSGLVLLALLMLVVLFIAVYTRDLKVIISTVPFFCISVIFLYRYKKLK